MEQGIQHSSSGGIQNATSWYSRLLSVAKREWIVVAVATFAFVWAIVASSLLFPFLTNNHDEAVYLLQANSLLEGKLYFTSNEFRDFFSSWFFVDDGEKIFSKYMPVHAGVLALGQVAFGSMRAAIGFVAAANVILFYLLAKECYQRARLALLATVLFTLSPLFLIQSATFLSYMTSLMFNLTFAVLFLRGMSRGSMFLLLGSGFVLGILIIARPFDAVLFAIPFSLLFLTGLSRNVQQIFGNAAYVVIGMIPPLVVGLVISFILSGNPLLFPFSVYDPLDTLGFGLKRSHSGEIPIDYDLAKGIIGLRSSVFQLSFWVFGGPLLLFLGYLGTILSRWTTWKLIAILLLVIFPVANIFFWGSYNLSVLWKGDQYLGPFYYIPMLIPITLLGTWGLARLWGWRPIVAITIILIMLVIDARLMMTYIDRNFDYTQKNRMIYQPFTQHQLDNSLVFVPPILGKYLLHPFALLVNETSLDGGVIYALNKGNANLDLMDKYEERTPYQFIFNGLYTEGPDDHIETELARIHYEKVANFSIPIHIVNPTDKPMVFIYTWKDDETATYILDDESRRDSSYDILLTVTTEGATIEGQYKEQLSLINSLSDEHPLTIGVAFSDTRGRLVQEIFEWRFWFRLLDDYWLEIVLPPESWHTPDLAVLPWRMSPIGHVMTYR